MSSGTSSGRIKDGLGLIGEEDAFPNQSPNSIIMY